MPVRGFVHIHLINLSAKVKFVDCYPSWILHLSCLDPMHRQVLVARCVDRCVDKCWWPPSADSYLPTFHDLSHPLMLQKATIGSVVRDMGWWQLATRGLGLRIVMIGTLTATQWAIYDSFKVYVGL